MHYEVISLPETSREDTEPLGHGQSRTNSLFLAWQAHRPTNAWFPIGRLDVEHDDYVFRYTQGALSAHRLAGFDALAAFPELRRRYEASTLFPLFSNRVLGRNRRDFPEYMRWLDLDPAAADPLKILELTGGERQTDSLAVFPKLRKQPDGSVRCRFFPQGLRHIADSALARTQTLQAEEPLQIALELNPPTTRFAVQLQTTDGHLIGWAPRYLVDDLREALLQPSQVSAKVLRLNEAGSPLARRLMVELACTVPADYDPMTSPDYEVIA